MSKKAIMGLIFALIIVALLCICSCNNEIDVVPSTDNSSTETINRTFDIELSESAEIDFYNEEEGVDGYQDFVAKIVLNDDEYQFLKKHMESVHYIEKEDADEYIYNLVYMEINRNKKFSVLNDVSFGITYSTVNRDDEVYTEIREIMFAEEDGNNIMCLRWSSTKGLIK